MFVKPKVKTPEDALLDCVRDLNMQAARFDLDGKKCQIAATLACSKAENIMTADEEGTESASDALFNESTNQTKLFVEYTTTASNLRLVAKRIEYDLKMNQVSKTMRESVIQMRNIIGSNGMRDTQRNVNDFENSREKMSQLSGLVSNALKTGEASSSNNSLKQKVKDKIEAKQNQQFVAPNTPDNIDISALDLTTQMIQERYEKLKQQNNN